MGAANTTDNKSAIIVFLDLEEAFELANSLVSYPLWSRRESKVGS